MSILDKAKGYADKAADAAAKATAVGKDKIDDAADKVKDMLHRDDDKS